MNKAAFFVACLCLAIAMPESTAKAEDIFDFDLSSAATQSAFEDKAFRYFAGGYLESREQYGFKAGKLLSSRQKLFAELNADHGNWAAYISGEGEFDPSIRSWEGRGSNVWQTQPRELYASYSVPAFDILVGRRIITWGTGDGVNFLDLFNPDDLRDPAADVRTRAKRPVNLVQAVWKGFSPLSIEGVFLPWGEVNKRWYRNSPWTPYYVNSLDTGQRQGFYRLKEDDTVSGPEGGLRASITYAGWDLALIFYNGYQNSPLYEQEYDGQQLMLREVHPRMRAWGLTFAKGFPGGTLRGEAAWKPSLGKAAQSGGIIRADHLEAVLGIDYTFLENFYWNIQYFVSSMTENRGAVANPDYQGATLSVSDKFFDDTLELGLKGIIYTVGEQGGSAQLYAAYGVGDHWKATLGLTFWGGPKSGTLGQYRDNDLLSFTLRYSF